MGLGEGNGKGAGWGSGEGSGEGNPVVDVPARVPLPGMVQGPPLPHPYGKGPPDQPYKASAPDQSYKVYAPGQWQGQQQGQWQQGPPPQWQMQPQYQQSGPPQQWPGQAQGQWSVPPQGQWVQYPAQQQPQWVTSAPLSVATVAYNVAPVAPTVIVQQQHSHYKDFEHGVCGCFEDIEICLCGTFCLPCLMCQNAIRLNMNLCVCCIVCWFLPCVLPGYIRGEARKKYNVKGGCCGDCLCGFCCTECIMCQVALEIKHHDG